MEIFSLRADELLIVADGKNDTKLFIPGIKSIIVANAHPDIKTLAQNADGYVAPKPDGQGFLEGLRYYGVIKKSSN